MNRTLARLIAGHVCLHACMAGTRLAAPLLALRTGHGEAAVGFLLALFALAQVFLALPAGRYADRHGLRRPVGIAVVVACLGVLASVIWPIYPVMCLSALASGGATGAASIALQRHVGRSAQGSTQLKQVFSWLAIGPAFSNFIGPFAAGLMIDHAGFRAAFALMAALPLVCWLWVRHVHEARAPQASTEVAAGRAWDLMREPGFRRLLLVNWMLSASWDVHTFVVPVLGHERGLSASVIGTLLGAFAVAASAVRVLMPLVAARLKEWAVLVAAMLASMVLFALYPFAQGAWAMGACSVLLGLFLGMVQPMVMSTLHQITPHHRHGEALGLRLMAINASSVMMPILFGAVGAAVGVSVVFWVTGAMVGAGSRLALGLREAHAHPGRAPDQSH